VVLFAQRDYLTAEVLWHRCLAGQEKVLGEEHPDTLGTAHNLAVLLSRQGRFDEAETVFRRTLDGSLRTFGPNHPDTQSTRSALETMLRKRRGWLMRIAGYFKKRGRS
jgi:hypothetical protein